MGSSSDADVDALLVREFYGSILLGTIFSTFLFGIDIYQFVTYFNSREFDPILIQSMVALLFCIDTLQEILYVYSAWWFGVQNFGNYAALVTQPWSITASFGILTAIIACSVQQYFIWRVKVFTQSWLVFYVLSLCSFTSAILGVVNAGIGIAIPLKVRLSAQLDMVNASLAIAVFVNVMNALCLLYYLLQHRTGFQRTDNIIRRLIVTCVESPLLNALFSLVDLIVFKIKFPSNYAYIVAMPMGRVYTLSVLFLLNSRASIRDAFNGIMDIDVHRLNHTSRLSRRFPFSKNEVLRVGVTVEQHATVEVDPFARSRDNHGHVHSRQTKTRTTLPSAKSAGDNVDQVHQMDEFKAPASDLEREGASL